MSGKCWDVIPCDDEMREHCPHFLSTDLCPMNCWSAVCKSPRREIEDDPFVVFGRTDLPTPAKKECLGCKVYLQNAVPGDKSRYDEKKWDVPINSFRLIEKPPPSE
ncbi:MAG: hypothetical protein ACYC1U_00315 [Candidatus Aquicultorales bacterium]